MCTRCSRVSLWSWKRWVETPKERSVTGRTNSIVRGAMCVVRSALLPKLFDVFGEQLTQPREARVALEVGARVRQGARDVLDVHRVPARQRLKAERAERFQVAL